MQGTLETRDEYRGAMSGGGGREQKFFFLKEVIFDSGTWQAFLWKSPSGVISSIYHAFIIFFLLASMNLINEYHTCSGMNSILLYIGHEMVSGMLPWSWRPFSGWEIIGRELVTFKRAIHLVIICFTVGIARRLFICQFNINNNSN